MRLNRRPIANAFRSQFSIILWLDVNECEDVNDCHTNALCTNTEGSYVCRCIRGYEGDGKTCTGLCFLFHCLTYTFRESNSRDKERLMPSSCVTIISKFVGTKLNWQTTSREQLAILFSEEVYYAPQLGFSLICHWIIFQMLFYYPIKCRDDLL